MKHWIFWVVVLGVIYLLGTFEVIFTVPFIPAAIVPKPIEQKEKDK